MSSVKTYFSLNITIEGRDTGTVIFFYFDKYNVQIIDTGRLQNGNISFSGTVNRACEALLWTDIANHNYDDSSVIRFLLEPDYIHIYYKPASGLNPIITGSKSQVEKEKWDKRKEILLRSKDSIFKSYLLNVKLAKINGASSYQSQINLLDKLLDSVSKIIRVKDVEYLTRHRNSFLSAYLLSRHKRQLPIDSVKIYYTDLNKEIKDSRLGMDILKYVFPLTDDLIFRSANPIGDVTFTEKLTNTKSVDELIFIDTSGNTIQLKSYKRKYLIIDFWASWCKPCIENIPALKQMTKDYERDSIQFISISLDKDLDQWRTAIKIHNFTGIQLSDSSALHGVAATFCKVLWVPTYIVADRNGRIIKFDAPQASNPALGTFLENLIKNSGNQTIDRNQ